MHIVEKYRKILEKPMAEPFRGYIEELVGALENFGDDWRTMEKAPHPKVKKMLLKTVSQKPDGEPPDREAE